MRIHRRSNRRAISALQLVVVLAILLFGLAFLFPIIGRVREAAARTHSMNNLRQLGIAVHNFAGTYFGNMPPAVGEYMKQSGPAHFHILPFIEQGPLFNAADGASWKNQTYGKVIDVYLDPRDPTAPDHMYKNWLATTNYAVNWMVCKEGKTKIGAIPDGTTQTLLFAERYQMCNGEPTAWGYPSLYTWAPIFAYYNHSKFQSAPSQDQCDPRRTQSIGRDMIVLFCDASARTLCADIRPTTWYYLCSPDDGNPIPQDDLD